MADWEQGHDDAGVAGVGQLLQGLAKWLWIVYQSASATVMLQNKLLQAQWLQSWRICFMLSLGFACGLAYLGYSALTSRYRWVQAWPMYLSTFSKPQEELLRAHSHGGLSEHKDQVKLARTFKATVPIISTSSLLARASHMVKPNTSGSGNVLFSQGRGNRGSICWTTVQISRYGRRSRGVLEPKLFSRTYTCWCRIYCHFLFQLFTWNP